MMQGNWATIGARNARDLDGFKSLIDGCQFRAAAPGVARGTVSNTAAGLILTHKSGVVEKLTVEHFARLEFNIDPAKVDDLARAQAATDPETIRKKHLGILGRVPDWAKRTVAAHLMPADLAAYDKEQRDARVERLRAVGRAASGKSEKSEPKIPPGQEERAAQLRAIGRAASTGR